MRDLEARMTDGRTQLYKQRVETRVKYWKSTYSLKGMVRLLGVGCLCQKIDSVIEDQVRAKEPSGPFSVLVFSFGNLDLIKILSFTFLIICVLFTTRSKYDDLF